MGSILITYCMHVHKHMPPITELPKSTPSPKRKCLESQDLMKAEQPHFLAKLCWYQTSVVIKLHKQTVKAQFMLGDHTNI